MRLKTRRTMIAVPIRVNRRGSHHEGLFFKRFRASKAADFSLLAKNFLLYQWLDVTARDPC
jgi:hypothetical protein